MMIGYKMQLPEEMDKQMKSMSSKIKKAAKKTDSQILKTHAKGMEMEENPEVKMHCRMVNMLVHEGLEMYESGEMSYEEMVEDLHEALKAV